MKISNLLTIAAALFIGGQSTANAATQYWDVNGTAPGATSSPGIADGAWDAAATNWNPLADGTGTTVAWTEGNDAVFSAGNDVGSDPSVAGAVVSITGSHTPTSLTIEEGYIEFTGTAGIAMGANPITIKSGATLSIPNQNVITATAGQVVTLDGGTISNHIVGVGSTFYTAGVATQWQVTANGGTVYTPNGGSFTADPINGGYSIMAYGTATIASTIGLAPATVSGTLHKTGHGEFRPFNSTNISAMDVQLGLLRAPSGSNDGAFGAVTGTVTVAGGAVENTTNGAAVGTTANLTADIGGAGPSPATRSWVLSGVGATPDSMFVLNANWQILGNISGAGGLMLNGWERNDAGAVIGSANELRLGGTNTYSGATTINFGTIVAQNGSAIPNGSRVSFSTRSAWGNGTTATFDTAVLRADASETVGSLSGGNATRGSVNINGAAVTLTTGADNTTSTFSGAITGAGGLTKSGTGTFTMDGAKSYTGDTTVSGGTLSTTTASLADVADVYLNTGSLFNLNFAGPDTIDSLFINGVSQAIGLWGAIGSGAAHESALLTGTGTLQVSTVAGPAGVPGDYNNNGVVDAADYVLWRNGGPLQNEVDTPGTVNAADYTAWRARFGNTSGAGSSLGNGSAVPEPTSFLLLVLCVGGLMTGRRGR